jgi:phosphoribosylglycinamide formyltransferase 1
MIRIVIIASTSGGVISQLLPLPYFHERIACVVADRQCGAIDVATKFDVPSIVIPSNDGLEFSNALSDRFLTDEIDLFVSFYKKMFRGSFLEQAHGRLVNLHPSILPACPGKDGFGDTLRSGAKFIGATIHYVDQGLDTGCPIIQSACAYNPNDSIEKNRHKVFVHQCKMLLQVIRWCEQDRLRIDKNGYSYVRNAIYESGQFSPSIDFSEAEFFDVPCPEPGVFSGINTLFDLSRQGQ